MDIETDDRPWGRWTKFIDNRQCTVKILEIEPGQAPSFQSHAMREELWFLISGKARVYLGPVKKSWKEIEPGLRCRDISAGSQITIKRNTVHSVENTGNEPCKILEISTGKFREDDEVRWKDRYGRV